MTIGILALQGDVREHAAAFAALGAATRLVRRPDDLDGLSGIVLPGGESTTLSMLLESSGLFDPLAKALDEGLPAFGTCAGLVLLSRRILDGRADQRSFGVLDCTVRRNGYGRQRFSFEGTVDASGLGRMGAAGDHTADAGGGLAGDDTGGDPDSAGAGPAPMPAVFIRAPVVVETGPEVEVLATLAGPGDGPGDGAGDSGPDPVAVRQGPVLATAFHPELTSDRRLHRLFLDIARDAGARSRR